VIYLAVGMLFRVPPALSVAVQPDQAEDNCRKLTYGTKRFRYLTKILDLRDGKMLCCRIRCLLRFAGLDQPALLTIRQRPQEHAAHNAEDRGICADTERQSEDDGDRETVHSSERS